MTTLVPMDRAAFEAFASEAIEDHAEDSVLAGRWLPEESRARARKEFERLLPDGMQTPGHEFFTIRETADGEVLGQIWFGQSVTGGERVGFLYNIRLDPRFRGQGHAARALQLLDRHALAHEVTVMRLHVFAFNTRAQALYRAAGYGFTGMNMLKRLHRDAA
ncbi:MAG: GNAT family N-acetyltransferase [Piscinibacter sp.]|nr:GNAT family N-acetyltransferase [Piscinibacter sp.]